MPRLSRPTLILILFVIINLVVALFIVGDYGRSTDETAELRRAEVAVDIYLGDLLYDLDQPYVELGEMSLKGTAVSGLIHLVERVFFPHTNHNTKVVAHYCYFVFFQMAVISLYLLGNHFFDQWVSLGIALLFGTQPLMFGHGFINPKDIPLLTMFLLAVVAGFRMVGIWISREDIPMLPVMEQARKASRYVGVLGLIIIGLWSRSLVTELVLGVVENAYITGDATLAGRILASLTTAGSLDGYLALAQIYLSQIYRWGTFLSVVLVAVVFHYAQNQGYFGGTIKWESFLAAAVWGFAISTRVIAITAGGIVGLYALIKLRQKAVFPLAIYSLMTSFFSYISWPLFWVFGLRGYFDSMDILSDFPWKGQVLFEGRVYDPQELPARYLPKLMGLQFTEPLVILVLVGLLVGLYLMYKKKVDATKLVLVYAWFLLPMLYVIIKKPVVYTNFRHFFFSIPPIFIFAGLALDQIMQRVKRPLWNGLLLVLILVPGIVRIVQYHPYQYIYYNSFIGGMDGAFKQYEMDYWATGYKEAMEFANENFQSGVDILMWKNDQNGEVYAEEFFHFGQHPGLSAEEMQAYDYAIMPYGRYDHLTGLQGAEVIHTVGLGGAKFIEVLKIGD